MLLKPALEQNSEVVPTAERRRSFCINRNSQDLIISKRDSYDGSNSNNARKTTEEENKYYHQSPLRKSAKPANPIPTMYNSHSNKQISDKENSNILRENQSNVVVESKEKKEEKDKIHNLINDVRNCLNPINKKKISHHGDNSDDEGFEEDADKRVYAR